MTQNSVLRIKMLSSLSRVRPVYVNTVIFKYSLHKFTNITLHHYQVNQRAFNICEVPFLIIPDFIVTLNH